MGRVICGEKGIEEMEESAFAYTSQIADHHWAILSLWGWGWVPQGISKIPKEG
jgi:hypothetical protein